MSLQAMSWAIKQETGSASAKSLLLTIANYADQDGICWPSQARLARDTELTDRTIRSALTHLEERSFIKRQKRGRQKSDVIQLIAGRAENASGQEKSRPENASGETGNNFQPSAETISDEPVKGTGKEPKKARKRACALPDDFPSNDLIDEAKAHWRTRGRSDLEKQASDVVAQFRDYHEARGSSFKSWPAAWRTWMRNAVEFSGDQQAFSPSEGRDVAYDPDLAAELERINSQ